MQMDFDFQRYVDVRKNPNSRRTKQGGFGEYAYSTDLRILRSLSYAKPVRLAAEATVRAFKAWTQSDILGQSVRVSPRQFPHIYKLTAECAEKLHIPIPTVYIYQNFGSINAATFGTDTDSFILMNSATVDRLSEQELKFVIGHECGHIQNSHVTYMTALHFLTNMGGMFVKWISAPATLALRGWQRRAEITCDRAGLLCVDDVDTAVSTMVRLAVGSRELAESIDMDAYLEQLADIKKGLGRISELLLSHPYLPKRVKALQLFSESDYYASHQDKKGGTPLHEVDREIDKIISVL